MKCMKIFAVCAAALLLLAPATAMAKTHFSLSINLFDNFPRVFLVPPPPPVVAVPVVPVYEPVFVPVIPSPYVQTRTIVKEYHYYGRKLPHRGYTETIQPQHPERIHSKY